MNVGRWEFSKPFNWISFSRDNVIFSEIHSSTLCYYFLKMGTSTNVIFLKSYRGTYKTKMVLWSISLHSLRLMITWKLSYPCYMIFIHILIRFSKIYYWMKKYRYNIIIYLTLISRNKVSSPHFLTFAKSSFRFNKHICIGITLNVSWTNTFWLEGIACMCKEIWF